MILKLKLKQLLAKKELILHLLAQVFIKQILLLFLQVRTIPICMQIIIAYLKKIKNSNANNVMDFIVKLVNLIFLRFIVQSLIKVIKIKERNKILIFIQGMFIIMKNIISLVRIVLIALTFHDSLLSIYINIKFPELHIHKIFRI